MEISAIWIRNFLQLFIMALSLLWLGHFQQSTILASVTVWMDDIFQPIGMEFSAIRMVVIQRIIFLEAVAVWMGKILSFRGQLAQSSIGMGNFQQPVIVESVRKRMDEV